MKRAWGQAAALMVAASVMFGATACGTETDNGGDTPGAAAASSKAADPKETLVGSLAAYDKGIYNVAFTGVDGTGTAGIDITKKSAHVKINSTDPEAKFTMEFLVIEPDSYLKMDMGELASLPGMELLNGKKWMHVDRTKIKDAEGLGSLKAENADMVGLKDLLGSAKDVKAAGDGKYSGTLDLTKGDDAPFTDEDVVKALADKATAVPFTATLDAEGRFSELLIDVPAAGDKKAHQLKASVSQYGSATIPAKPTGKDVVEAPASTYEMLNS